MILFFGRLRETVGASQLQPEFFQADMTLSSLIGRMSEIYPELAQQLARSGVRYAVNQKFVGKDEDPVVSPADEIAFMPPMSGG